MTTTMGRKAAKPLLGERLDCISLSFAREQVRTLTNKVTGLARSERHRVAEIYGAMHRGNPVALEEAYRFFGSSVAVRDKVRQVRAGVIASSPGMVCTSAEPQQHAKVGDLWNPRRDDEDDYSFAVRLKAPGGGAFVFSEAGEWVPLTDETQHLVGKWGRDEALELDEPIERAEAMVTLARWLWAVVLAHFERQLQLTPFIDDRGAYASANHALFALTEQIGGERLVGADQGRLQRVFVAAQAEWRRLALRTNEPAPGAAKRKTALRRKRRSVKRLPRPAEGSLLRQWEQPLINMLLEDMVAGRRDILQAKPGELAARLSERHGHVLPQSIARSRIPTFNELREFLASASAADRLPATLRASLGTAQADAIEELLAAHGR